MQGTGAVRLEADRQPVWASTQEPGIFLPEAADHHGDSPL